MSKLVITKRYPEIKVGYCDVAPRRNIFKQSQIDNLQQAFNILQSDLEVLKEYEC